MQAICSRQGWLYCTPVLTRPCGIRHGRTLPRDLVDEPGGRARRRFDIGGLGRINRHADGNPAEHIRVRIMQVGGG
jgi:hypothetical protein